MPRVALVFAVAITAAVVGGGASLAHDYTIGNLKIVHPWARATPKGASVGGGYLTVINTGSTADRLVGGSSDVAKSLEIHEMRMRDGAMTMREHKDGLEIKPGETVELKPNGYHLMFVELRKQLMQGERVDATLKFEKAGTVSVYFKVESIGAQRPDGKGHDAMPGMEHGPK